MKDSEQELADWHLLFDDNIEALNWLHDARNKYFQMVGMYDGAMSEECKELFRARYDAAVRLLAVLERE